MTPLPPLGIPNIDITYWNHPESDSVWIHDPSTQQNLDSLLSDGMSHDISVDKYVKYLIDQIDTDPEHKLPEGVDAVIKLAVKYPNNIVSGMIWYDTRKRMINGYPITTAPIVKWHPGDIGETALGNKFLVEFIYG